MTPTSKEILKKFNELMKIEVSRNPPKVSLWISTFKVFKKYINYKGTWTNFKKMLTYMSKKPKLNLKLIIYNCEVGEEIEVVI